MENQFPASSENPEQDEYLNFLDTRPLQESNSAAITPQAILARSSIHSSTNLQSVSPASVLSPMTQTHTMHTASPQQVLNSGPTPQQVLTHSVSSQQLQNQAQSQVPVPTQSQTPTQSQIQAQAPTPQAILSNTNSVQDPQLSNTNTRSNSAFADRTAMFAALQQRQQQQRQKLQMMQQTASRTGSPQDSTVKRPSAEPQSQSSSTGQIQQIQGNSPNPDSLQQQPQQRQAIQNLDPDVQRRVSSELNNKQFELFMKSLVENCKRRNAPLHSFPEIQGRRVNLFVLYTMVQKLGGGESVTRFQQWPMLTQKLRLPDDSSQQLATLYYHLLLPYEQYLASPEGIKETQSKRLFLQQFLQELLKKILGTPAIAPPANETRPSNYASASHSNSPDPNKVKKPRKPKTKKKSKKDLEREMKYQQEQLQRQHQIQQEQQSKLLMEQKAKQQLEQLRLQQQQALQHSIEYQKLPKFYKRSFARNYVPSSRPIETSNGYDMRAVSQIGEKIDANKPVFLFAPELGTINLHALSMSLLSGCLSEVNVALNTLLVTSADSVLSIPLDRFNGLIDSLTILGCQLLNKLCLSTDLSGPSNEHHLKDYDVDILLREDTKYSRASDMLDAVFEAKLRSGNNEDLTIRVDSLTGVDLQQVHPAQEQIPVSISNLGDDEEEKDEEKPQKRRYEFSKCWHYLPEALCVADDMSTCKLNVTDYLSSLRTVRDEVDSLSTKVTTRGAENHQLMMVDQLSTISMIIRNLSFNEVNTSPIATSQSFKRFLSDLTWALFLHSDKFLFHRKCFNFRKDIIITLTNIAHLFKIEDHVCACLLIFLILSFAEGRNQLRSSESPSFLEYSVKISNYQSFGVDVLAKLLSLGYPNRVLLKAVLLQQFKVEPQMQDVKTCQKLISLYEASAPQEFKGLVMLHDTFASLVSTIPFQQLNTSPALVEDAGPIISQSITALLSLTRMCQKETIPRGAVNLPLLWLTSEENVGSSLRRLSEALSNLGIHTNGNLKHLKYLFNSISIKTLRLVNLLIERALDIADHSDDDIQIDYHTAVRKLNSVPNLLPSEANAFSLLTNPMADFAVAKEMEELYRIRSRLIAEDNDFPIFSQAKKAVTSSDAIQN
ncbi:LANO_0E10462g1_1 [Lachancea nothofagi CBS 11611]|uniref:LANO_0E10462g1_1 n=1 Tax=Lachancea nothofagi CBS 11611 TaxID=1266666 RepID=A0A1G4JWK2_9SACH|nr:LANO_0E10462g1_1 [Lachancea nothofagi CBS 11611]